MKKTPREKKPRANLSTAPDSTQIDWWTPEDYIDDSIDTENLEKLIKKLNNREELNNYLNKEINKAIQYYTNRASAEWYIDDGLIIYIDPWHETYNKINIQDCFKCVIEAKADDYGKTIDDLNHQKNKIASNLEEISKLIRESIEPRG